MWIYQASKIMSDEMVAAVEVRAKDFIQNWTAHQTDLKASVSIYHNLFIVFAVDESYNDASGCSIDKKVHFIKSIEEFTGVDFFDRMKIAYLDHDRIKLDQMNRFSSLIEDGTINTNTIIFNNLVTTLNEFRSSWKTPIANSWLVNVI